ncbi:MAG TPA: hypothetical protein VK447_21480, partial [Myxococcaceae bacterium]|nr:hypothetical protein [Myxococcaceae bacterium]
MKPRENLFMPRHQLGRLSSAVLAVLLLSASALAAKAPPPAPAPATPPPATKWAILPLVVVGGEGKEAKQYQAAFESEVTKSSIDRANPKLVTGFLTQEANCIRKDECLGRLAKAVNAERTLLVTISPFAKEIVLTAKMIGLNGNVLNETASTVNRGPNETALAASRDSFEVLLSDLQTELVPLSPPPAQTPKPSPPVADAPKTESPPTATAPQTPPSTTPATPTGPSAPSATP